MRLARPFRPSPCLGYPRQRVISVLIPIGAFCVRDTAGPLSSSSGDADAVHGAVQVFADAGDLGLVKAEGQGALVFAGALQGPLGALQIDILRALGGVGENRSAIARHLEEAAVERDGVLIPF